MSGYVCPHCNNAVDENVPCWFCTCCACSEPEDQHTDMKHAFTPTQARRAFQDGVSFDELTVRAKSIPVTARQREEQRRSFAHGNVGMHNPAVTRDVVDQAAVRVDQAAMLRAPRIELEMMDRLDPPEAAAQLSIVNGRLMLCVPINVKFDGGTITASRWYQAYLDEISEDVRTALLTALTPKEA